MRERRGVGDEGLACERDARAASSSRKHKLVDEPRSHGGAAISRQDGWVQGIAPESAQFREFATYSGAVIASRQNFETAAKLMARRAGAASVGAPLSEAGASSHG